MKMTRPDTLTTMEVCIVKSMPGTSDPNVTVTGTALFDSIVPG
jgi:hypothetical protein